MLQPGRKRASNHVIVGFRIVPSRVKINMKRGSSENLDDFCDNSLRQGSDYLLSIKSLVQSLPPCLTPDVSGFEVWLSSITGGIVFCNTTAS